jgi:thiol-disulfide isomerase/thioredoxin
MRHRTTSALVALATTSALLLGACGTATEADGEAAAGSTGGAAAGDSAGSGGSESGGQSGGQSVDLDFSATTLDGTSFSGEQLEGKPAVLWFWAPWCPTCRAQSSNVSALALKYDGKVNVVGVGGLDNESAIEDYATSVEGVTHLVDDEGAVWRHFGVEAQSTYVVVDAQGNLVADGYLDDGVLNDKVAGLVG